MDIEALAAGLGLDTGDYIDLINLFVETGGKDLDRVQAALDQNDFQLGARAAHSLKGASASLGLTDINQSAIALEHKLLTGDLNGSRSEMQKLHDALGVLAASNKS